MKVKAIALLFATFCLFGMLSGQTLKPLPEGKYKWKKVGLNDEKFSMVNGQPVKVEMSKADEIRIGFPLSRAGSWTYRTSYYMRLKDNVFVGGGYRGDHFNANPESILVLQEGGSMEMYRVRGGEKRGCLLIAGDGADMKALKGKVKANNASLDLDALLKEIAAINVEYAAEKEAAEAAEKAAAIAAEAKDRADADLCSPINQFVGEAAAEFVALKGAMDEAESELEGEDIYRSTVDLPFFYKGLILPTYIDDNMRLTFRTYGFENNKEAKAELQFVLAKLAPCFKDVNGFVYSVDSGIHMYKKNGVIIGLTISKDMDDEGHFFELLKLTVQHQ